MHSFYISHIIFHKENEVDFLKNINSIYRQWRSKITQLPLPRSWQLNGEGEQPGNTYSLEEVNTIREYFRPSKWLKHTRNF